MKDIYLEKLFSERMTYIDTSQIRKVFDLAQTIKNPVNLSIGQPHFPMPEPVAEALQKAIRDGKTSYTQTQGIKELREKLAEKFYKKNKIITSPDAIIVSSGVSSLLFLIFMSMIDKGDEVLLVEPAFLIYRSLVSFFQAKEILIPQNFRKEDIENLRFRRLKLILFSNPSNPSGYILKKHQMEALIEISEKTGALIVSDEIYEHYDYENRFFSIGSLYPEVLTLMGFSKSYSMTGLRLSAATGPKTIINNLVKLQQYTVVCAPSIVQYAGIVALDQDISHWIDYYRENRNILVSFFRHWTGFYEPEGAFYLFARVPGNFTDMEFCEMALKEKLLIVPGSIFTPEKHWVRISYAVDRNVLLEGVKAFEKLYNA